MINHGERIPTGAVDGDPGEPRTAVATRAVTTNTPTAMTSPAAPKPAGKHTEFGPRPARPALPALSSARAGVLRAVTAAGTAVTVSALAEQLGQHPNTIREHLDALVDGEHLERVRSSPTGRGRPAWLYRSPAQSAGGGPGDLMDGPLGDGGHEYLALAVALMDQVATTSPDPESLARKAGERWGRTLADRLVTGPGDAVIDDDPPADAGTALPTAEAREHDPADAAVRPATPADTVVGMLRSLRFEPERTEDPKRIRLTTCPLLDAARRHPGVVCQVHTGIVRGALERLGGDPEGTQLAAFAEPGACLLTLPDAR